MTPAAGWRLPPRAPVPVMGQDRQRELHADGRQAGRTQGRAGRERDAVCTRVVTGTEEREVEKVITRPWWRRSPRPSMSSPGIASRFLRRARWLMADGSRWVTSARRVALLAVPVRPGRAAAWTPGRAGPRPRVRGVHRGAHRHRRRRCARCRGGGHFPGRHRVMTALCRRWPDMAGLTAASAASAASSCASSRTARRSSTRCCAATAARLRSRPASYGRSPARG